MFPLFRIILYCIGLKQRGSLNYQGFINSFDGPENPLGKVYSKKEAKALLGPLESDAEIHYFPVRFIPCLKRINLPKFILEYFDRYFGFLIYLKGIK